MVFPPRLTGLPEHPVLRPGLAVTRHDDHRLQVGIDPPQRVVVPDLPAVRRLLDALAHGEALAPPDEHTWPVLRHLCEAGLVVDSRTVAVSTTRGPAPAARAAWAQFGSDAGEHLAARASARIAIAADDESCADATRLLRAAGTTAVEVVEGTGTTEGGTDGLAVDAWLVVSDGEPSRTSWDHLVREGVPHLLVTAARGWVHLGPFVLPGVTACLRCLDAHRAETDPRRSLVVEQIASQLSLPHRDPVLHAMALAWAVRDLLRFVEGEHPSTWSTTFEVGPVAAPLGHLWTRHPHCGCSWDETLAEQVAG